MSDKKSISKTTKKNTVKKAKSPKSKKSSTKQQANAPSRLTWLLKTSLKLLVVLLLGLSLYVIYLDGKVRHTFEGQRWQVPVQVYGQIKTLMLAEPIELNDIAQSLKLSGYQKVTHAQQPGQFEQSAEKLIFFRREFDLGNALLSKGKAIIELEDGKVSALFLANEPVNQLSLEPILIDRILPQSKEDRVLDVSAAAAFKQLIPSARVHIFEGVGHLPMVEIPNESAAVYQQFLSTVE